MMKGKHTMLDWKKSTPKHLSPFADGDLSWIGHTPDGFFYDIDQWGGLRLMTNNISGCLLANIRCVRSEWPSWKLYVYKPTEFEINYHPQEPGFADNRWYFVNCETSDVYVANHNGETIRKALEGTETLR